MAILSDTRLQELNREMLGLGRPDERDDVGYNKPDYNRMEALGRFIGAFNNDMRFAIAEGLSHYKNTQLTSVKDDLEETCRYFKELLKVEKPQSFTNMHEFYDRDSFISRGIHFDREDDNNVYLSFDGKVYLYNFAPYYRDYGWTDRTYTSLRVAKERLEDFIERLAEYGEYGYKPDEDLAKVIERVKDELENKTVEQKNNAPAVHDTLLLVDKTETGVYVKFEGFADIRDFIADEKKNFGEVFRWNNMDGKYVLWVDEKELPYLYGKAESLGFTNSTLKERFADFKYLSTEERLNERKQGLKTEREQKNLSGNTLIDVNSLSLPFKPYDFQIEDAKNIVSHKSMLIGHDMGCGKTFIASLVGTSIGNTKLVICPESLRLNWRKEIKNVNPDADIRILYSKDKFDFDRENMPEWIVTGYATVAKYGKDLSALADEGLISCTFIDEAHNGKAIDNMGNPASKRANAILDICEKVKYVYPMTGTPIPTRNKDLFNIFKMMGVEEIGGVKLNEKWGFFNYGKEFCDGYNNGFGWDFSGNSNSELLHDELQEFMVRRLKSDVLPNLTKQRLFIPTETHSREYKRVEKQLENMGSEDTYMALAMHGRAVLSKDKVDTAIDLAESILEEDKSIVIVSNFNETLDKVVEKFGDDCCTIRGGMTDTAKQQAIDDFQSGKKKVCALNIIAGGVGVTLTKASDMIICDYDWTPSNMSQVEDRICRAGQTKPCQIHYIYCENAVLDEIFVDMITGKSANIDSVVDGKENTMDLSEGVSYMQRLKARFPQKESKEMQTISKSDVAPHKSKANDNVKW